MPGHRIVHLPSITAGCMIAPLHFCYTSQVAVLLRLQMERMRSAEEHGVLLVLGSTDWQRQMLAQELMVLDPELAKSAAPVDGGSPTMIEVITWMTWITLPRPFLLCECPVLIATLGGALDQHVLY